MNVLLLKRILKEAKGQTINFMMWQGDPQINRYISDYVVPMVKKEYDINVQVSAGQGNQIVAILV